MGQALQVTKPGVIATAKIDIHMNNVTPQMRADFPAPLNGRLSLEEWNSFVTAINTHLIKLRGSASAVYMAMALFIIGFVGMMFCGAIGVDSCIVFGMVSFVGLTFLISVQVKRKQLITTRIQPAVITQCQMASTAYQPRGLAFSCIQELRRSGKSRRLDYFIVVDVYQVGAVPGVVNPLMAGPPLPGTAPMPGTEMPVAGMPPPGAYPQPPAGAYGLPLQAGVPPAGYPAAMAGMPPQAAPYPPAGAAPQAMLYQAGAGYPPTGATPMAAPIEGYPPAGAVPVAATPYAPPPATGGAPPAVPYSAAPMAPAPDYSYDATSTSVPYSPPAGMYSYDADSGKV
jgi:hypothetical protein